MESEAVAIIRDFVAAFRAYEMDVGGGATRKHREMMERAERFLAGSGDTAPREGEVEERA